LRFSTRGRYGLLLMIDLAQNSAQGPVSLKSIAERQNLSEHYLEQIVPDLRKNGLVKSIRGAQGGYILNKSPNEINVGDVIRVLEGPIAPVECENQMDEECCANTDFCINREVWVKVRDSITDVVDSISLADLLQGENKEIMEQ
jgi:Rrf2 family cysteine metabolism transcriptional repressor